MGLSTLALENTRVGQEALTFRTLGQGSGQKGSEKMAVTDEWFHRLLAPPSLDHAEPLMICLIRDTIPIIH